METAVPAGRVLASVLVQGGTVMTVPLAAAEDLSYPLTGEESLKVVARAPFPCGSWRSRNPAGTYGRSSRRRR